MTAFEMLTILGGCWCVVAVLLADILWHIREVFV